MLASAAIIGLAIAGIPFTGGASLIAMHSAGGLLALGGATLFGYNRQKGLSKELANLSHVAQLK
ncbi:MAG TPA: hypothetical protein VHM20_03015 [Gammaproteobacteria bacterium]|nr:hypothetical protein [Gammaproteobacteria bacterium]